MGTPAITPTSPTSGTIVDLGRKVKAKYPQYGDMPDIEVGRRVKAKFPQEYGDFSDVAEAPTATGPISQTTKLSPQDEQRFQSWYKNYSKVTGNSPNPDEPEHYYDYRGYFSEKQGKEPLSPEMHLPDTYKRPGHPTYFVRPGVTESKYKAQQVIPGTEKTGLPGVPTVKPQVTMQPAAGPTSLAGFRAGLSQTQEAFGGAMEMIGSATGIKSVQDYGGSVRKAGAEEAEQMLPKITSLDQIRNPSDAVDYLTFAIGNAIPSSVPTLAGAVAGVPGIFGMSWLQQAGAQYADLIEKGHDAPYSAAAVGIPMAVLDIIKPVKIAGKLFWRPAEEAVKKELAKTTVGSVLKRGAKYVGKEGALEEGLPEAGQEILGIGHEWWKTGKMPANIMARVMNAFASGTIGGTALGGAADIAAKAQARAGSVSGTEEYVQAPPPVAAPVTAPVEAPAVVPVEAAAPTPVVSRDTSTPVPLEGLVAETERRAQFAEKPPEPTQYQPQPPAETFQEAQERRRRTPEPVEPQPPGAPARDEQQLKSVADFAATRRAISVASIQREFRLKFAEAQSVIQELENRGLLIPQQKGGTTIWKRATPPPAAAPDVGTSGVAPVAVQTDTVPWSGPPPPQVTPEQATAVAAATQAVDQALPPAPILPEILEPSPPPTNTPQVTDVPGTTETAAPEPLTAAAPEQPTPQELQTALEQRQAEEPAVEAPSISDTMTRYSAKHAGKEAKVTVTKLGKTNQWYASINHGGQAVESVYADTKEKAEAALAVKMNERMDLLEAQDQNMEALLQASLTKAAPTAPLQAPTTPVAATQVVAPSTQVGPLTLKPRDIQPNTLISHEIGIPEFEGMAQTFTVPVGGVGVSLVIDSNTALATPTAPGVIPSGAVKGLVVNTGKLPSPIGIAKSRINAIAQQLGIPVHYLSSKKAVDYFINNLKLDQDLSKIRSKQSESGFIRLDMDDMATITRELARKLQDSVKNLPFMAKGQVQDEITKYNAFSKHSLGIVQLQERNPEHGPLNNYVENAVRAYFTTKNAATTPATQTMKAWNKLSFDEFRKLVDYSKDVADKSFKEGRLIGEPELVQMAADRKLKKSTFEVYHHAREAVQHLFDMQEKISVARAETDEQAIRIQQTFNDLRNRNYFPQQIFGPHVVEVRAKEDMEYDGRQYKAGELIERSGFESANYQNKRMAQAEKDYPAGKVDIKKTRWSDSAAALRGYPAFSAMLDGADDLEPGEAEKLSEEQGANQRSESALIRQMKRERTHLGYSRDAQRAFMNFFVNGANHVARMTHGPDMKQYVAEARALSTNMAAGDATKLDGIAEMMDQHMKDVLNPGKQWAGLSGWLFQHYFMANPKQAFVNFLQVPMMTYPYLAATYGKMSGTPIGKADLIVAKELMRAGEQAWKLFDIKDREFHITNMGEGLTKALHRAAAETVLGGTFAGEYAGMAHGNLARRMIWGRATAGPLKSLYNVDYYAREFTRYATEYFGISEQHNRYTSFIAGYNLAKKMGMNEEAAYKYARDATEKPNFIQHKWAQPRAMRGWLAPALIFKSFQQNSLFNYGLLPGQAGGKGMPGRGRALGVMLAFGGLMGVPWMKDAFDMISALGTWGRQFFGVKNPRFDLEEEARMVVESWHMDPHLFMNGIASESFLADRLNALVGAPIPSVDISASLQQGRVLPGVRPLAGMITGTESIPKGVVRALTELSGVGGSTGMNMARVIGEDSPEAMTIAKYLMPAGIRNVAKAYEMATRGKLTNSRGEKLIDVDMSNTRDQLSVLMQLMGFGPTDVAAMQARKFANAQASQYYQIRRQLMYNLFSHLAGKGEHAKASEALSSYNEQMPPEFRITRMEAVASYKRRAKNQGIKEAGQPLQPDYRQLYENNKKAYNIPGQQ